MSGQQLTLDLSHRPALAREDFLVSPSNASAVALVDQWPNWPTHGAVIVGAPGSGKSHLASVWQQRTGAALRKADTLSVDSVADDFASGSLVVEDADAAGLDERALFHALNLARQQGRLCPAHVGKPVGQWPLRLPDLVSRLKALPEATILPPDDALLRGVLVKHFADRQIAVAEPVISFILMRMPRSMEALRTIVGQIDARALAEKAEVTRPFVARVLAEYAAPDLFHHDEDEPSPN
jgi:chromosomal replication initiation ATPase DnaA